ncbi:cell envelope integrity protein TolA [Bdellovibrio sp. GT3]|uniref:cell envelope integrity protein TolA n=1 Tax=Bdellovibrio sp. GT3 TaxID=3136282 RepID=UPI0030F1613C
MMKSPSFKKYVLLSVAVHVVVFGGLYLVEALKHRFPKQEAVSIDLISPEEAQMLMAAQQAEQMKKAPAPTVPKNQVVEQSEKSLNETEPVNSRFLSVKNQTVTKQTIAKEHGEFQNLKKEAPQKTGPKGDGKAKSAAKAEPKATPEQREKIARDLFKNFDAAEALERQKVADLKKEAGEQAGQGLGRGNGEMDTNEGSDVSRSNDYVKDVEQGLETMLNTREFKYYSYYNRIRRQLSQHWEGKVREKLSKMFKEGRSPASTGQDRVTKLMIVLNDKGTLVNVQVMSDSGVRDLDEAAVEAFRAAAPFPNPPKGIIEGDGTVKIRWDFVLES